MIVEDDVLIVRMLVRTFRKLPILIRSASNAQAALEVLEAEKFDVVWSDLNLGHGGDGVDVLQRARELMPDALLIIVTGSVDRVGYRPPPNGTQVFAKTAVDAALDFVREHVDRKSFRPSKP